MPFSAGHFDELFCSFCEIVGPQRVLDVGCGSGKYARLVKGCSPKAHLVGYEPCTPYIERFSLRELYDELRNEPVEKILSGHFREHYDMCVFGDVLEHLCKSGGSNVIHYLLYRSRFVVIVVPQEYLQDDFDGVATEAHVSSWHPLEFSQYTDTVFVSNQSSYFSVLRGFRAEKLELLGSFRQLERLGYGLQYFPNKNA